MGESRGEGISAQGGSRALPAAAQRPVQIDLRQQQVIFHLHHAGLHRVQRALRVQHVQIGGVAVAIAILRNAQRLLGHILLGKQLPTLSDDLKAQAKEIAGCENRVWLGFSVSGEKLHFFGDSEGRIVRGLLAVLLTAVEGKSAAELLAHSPLMFFDELGLRAQLSASRGQGLIALSDAVLDAARQAQA